MNHQGFAIPSLWNLDIGYKVSSRESGLTQIVKKLLAHAIFVSTFFLLSDWGKNFHPSMCMLHLTKIDICAFSRRIYPKRLTVHSGCKFFVSMCAAWEFNPQPFALLSNAMPYLWGTQERSCWRFVGCTSMMRISRSTTSQSCSIGLRSGDCGGHLSKVNSLSCSRNQSEMIWALRHGALSCWKYLSEDGYTVVIKGWTWSATILR